MPNRTTDVDRRTFLRRATVTGAVGLGALGVTTGSATARAVGVPRDRTESLLDAHADAVLSMLESDGVLADRDELPTAVENDLAGVLGGREGAALFSVPGRPEELRVVADVDGGTLTVAVRPADGHAFAVLDTGNSRVGWDVDDGRFELEPQSCSCTGTKCGPYPTVGYLKACCYGSSCDYECTCL